METRVAEGICKIKGGWATEDSVRIRYPDGTELEIPASRYSEQGYSPALDDLPWCENAQRN